METILRTDCDNVAYGYFDPRTTSPQLAYEEAAVRMALCLKDMAPADRWEVRERMKRMLPQELYLLALEKLADGEPENCRSLLS